MISHNFCHDEYRSPLVNATPEDNKVISLSFFISPIYRYHATDDVEILHIIFDVEYGHMSRPFIATGIILPPFRHFSRRSPHCFIIALGLLKPLDTPATRPLLTLYNTKSGPCREENSGSQCRRCAIYAPLIALARIEAH